MARLILGESFAGAARRWQWLHQALWLVEASLIGLALRFCALLPVDRASAMGRRIMRWLGPRLAKHDKIRDNLRLIFPDMTDAALAELSVDAWGNVGAVLAEYGHLGEISDEHASDRLEIEVLADIDAFRPGGRPAVFVASHLANFEVCAAAIRRMAGGVTVVYRPLKNPWLNRILYRYRATMGCGLLSADESPRRLLGELREGRSIGIVMDQRHDSGVPVPMFGIPKPTTLIPARLALRERVELVPIRAERLEGGRFRVSFHAPITAGDDSVPDSERALAMTARVNALFESWIRARPQDWLPMRLVKARDLRDGQDRRQAA